MSSLGGTVLARISALPLVVVAVFPVRACELMPSRGPVIRDDLPASTTKRETPTERVKVVPPTPPRPRKRATYPEGVVVRALDALQPAFMRCYLRALNEDPSLGPTKVIVHLEVSEFGAVTRAHATTDDAKLANCVSIVARGLAFPAAGEAAVLDVPLFFRR